MASEARARSPHDGRRRDQPRSPHVPAGLRVRRVPPPRCPCRCCDAAAACLPTDRTLERLQRRLGRARDERPSRHQRLQALTERLLPRAAPATAPAAPAPAPPPAPPPAPHSAPVLPPVPPPRVRHRHSPPRGLSADFDADNITLVRVEPRSIVGSYAQKTIPYRSASFSQGDFAPDKYYRGATRQPSIFDFGRRPTRVEAAPARADSEDASGSVASVDSAVGSDEGLLAHASPAPRSPPPEPHKPLSARSLTHPLPRRAAPAGGGGGRAAAGSLPALMAPRVLHELREESDGSQADSAQPRSEAASPLEARPFAFPPLPDPPAPTCVNPDCECADITESREDPASVLESSIPVPVYECIVKQWSKELPQDEHPRSGAASDGSLDRDKEDETITSEQVAHLLAAVQNPCSPAPIGARERRRPLDKTKRRKGIYITTASDDGGEEDPPSSNGKRESGEASPRDTRLSDEARTSSLLGDKSDDSCANGPPSPCDMPNLMWPRSEELRTRRSRLSHQSSDERDDDSYRTRRKFGVTSRGDSPSESDSWSRDRTASPSPFSPEEAEARRQQLSRSFGRSLAAPARAPDGRRSLSDAAAAAAAGGAGGGGGGGGHVRATSSPSKLAGARAGELLAELLRGSSEALSNAGAFDNVVLTLHQHNDTRTHVVVELYETEKSYVDALDILVKKYLEPLKSPENAGLLESFLVDEIFYQIPAILSLHQTFLEQLRRRLEQWDLQQKVGDVFLEVLTKPPVMDTYMSFISNLRRARAGSKAAAASRPAFARFLDALARGHKGKLSLDNLLIKPVQRFPSYKLLIQRLIKHTEPSHPDHALLVSAQKEIHSLLELINCTERESEEQEQQLQALRDLEQAVEGLSNLAAPDRWLIRHSCVRAPAAAAGGAGAGAAPALKERALFLLSDTLLIASVKRRANAVKKPIPTYQSNIASQMEGNKYKLLMRIPLADLEIVKAKDENLRRIMHEVETLTQDVATLSRIAEQLGTLHAPHAALDELVRDALRDASRQLAERRGSDTQLCCMELSLATASGPENLTLIFSNPESRSSWEELINDTKQKLCVSGAERAAPVFLAPVPIRKTRAGLQFTCAAPTTPPPGQPPDVWVCNSDGYVGQVCVLSLVPRPQVASCSGVCNARILALAAVPPRPPRAPRRTPSTGSLNSSSSAKPGISVSDPNDSCKNIRLDSSSSSEEEDEGSSASSSADAERRAEAERRTCEPARGACDLARGASGVGRGASDPARGSCGAGRGAGDPARGAAAAPAHAKSLSAPAPPPPPHPVTKSSSNPTVDKYAMGINTGTLSTPASRQSSEDAGSGAAMWLGTEDGCVHVFSQDNIRAHKHKLRMQHSSPVHCIVYEEGKVFVALGNGDVVVYSRDIDGVWAEQCSLAVGGGAAVGGMLAWGGRLWCAAHAAIKIINPHTLQTEETFQISSESKPISHMAASGGGVWLALHHAAQLRCYRASTRDQLANINLTPVVTKMLHGCDDIIRQHKAACLRVTALAAHAGVLWVGTSAGVLLSAPLQRAPDPSGAFTPPPLQGIPYGHTGHVRFLTIVENPAPHRSAKAAPPPKAKAAGRRGALEQAKAAAAPAGETLVISGGDGYEDFRSSSAAEDAGREDSTNHLLLWRV